MMATAIEESLAQQAFDEIRALSPDTEGVSRPAFSDIETRTLDWLAGFARANGLCVEEDATCCSACPNMRMPKAGC